MQTEQADADICGVDGVVSVMPQDDMLCGCEEFEVIGDECKRLKNL